MGDEPKPTSSLVSATPPGPSSLQDNPHLCGDRKRKLFALAAARVDATANPRLAKVKKNELKEEEKKVAKKLDVSTSSLLLKSDDELYAANIKVFTEAYEGSRTFRISLGTKSNAFSYLSHTYIETADVVSAIKEVCEHPKFGEVRKAQLGSLAADSVENAAQSAVYFISFLRHAYSEKSSATTKQLIEFLEEEKRIGEDSFIGVLSKFYAYYAVLPCSRQSVYKMEICQNENAGGREVYKEISTLRTVIRGLLAFLTMVGVVPQSSPRSPDPLCKKIWLTINAKQKEHNLKSAGAVKIEKWPLTLVDIVELMRRTEGVRTQAECQSWLYALVLSGVGLRPGSVKTQRVRAADALKQLKEEEKDDDQNNNNNGGADDEEDAKILNIDFTGLRAKDVSVFIKARKEGDLDVRLRVELKVRKDKVTGTKKFAYSVVGLHHPSSMAEDKEDWSPGAALALTLLCISAKTVDPDMVSMEMAPEEGEMEITRIGENGERPIFRRAETGKRGHLLQDALVHEQPIFQRLLHSLGIPHSTYSTKSLRCGYAERILTDHVLRRPPGELVSRETIRGALYTAGRWRSAQADTYIRQSLGNLDRYGSSDGGSTATDWLKTRYRSMASSRTASPSYRVFTTEDARQQMTDEQVSSSSLTEMSRFLTYRSFHQAQPLDKTDAEIREFFLNRPVVDVRKAVDEYCSLMCLDLDNFPFYKIARTTFHELAAPFYCIVEGCNRRFSTAKKVNRHWNEDHDSQRRALRYVCPCNNSNSGWRNLLRHLRTAHEFLNTDDEDYAFNWRMRDSAEEGVEKRTKKGKSVAKPDSEETSDSEEEYVSAEESTDENDDTVDASSPIDQAFNEEDDEPTQHVHQELLDAETEEYVY